ncbi:MAG: hypothetical protein JNM07_04310 [Phycisphaerae bacterium]|nr:hypothetical protein [Phycisphaerae bacterium]
MKDTAPNLGIERHLDVTQSGRFLAKDYYQPQARLADWLAVPHYFVHFDGHVMRIAQPPGGTYEERPAPPGLMGGPPGPIQWTYCPWPVIPKLVEWLEKAPDLHITVSREGEYSATSVQSMLALDWNNSGRIQRVAREEATGYVFAVSFGYAEGEAESLPRPISLHETIRSEPASRVKLESDHDYNVIAFDIAAAGSESDPAFDPVALKTNRFDPKTKDVFAPDGSKLYNEDSAMAAFDAAAGKGTWRPWLLGLIGAAAVLSVIASYRRLKRGA